MSQFLHSYPELQDNPQLLTGAVQVNGVPLARMRLAQLRNLARAYDVPINMTFPKRLVLPAMEAAASSGAFQGKPSRPLYLLKAGWTSDEKMPIQHEDIFNPDGTERTSPAPVGVLKSHAKNEDQIAAFAESRDGWHELRARVKAKDPDFKVHGKKKEELLAFLGETE